MYTISFGEYTLPPPTLGQPSPLLQFAHLQPYFVVSWLTRGTFMRLAGHDLVHIKQVWRHSSSSDYFIIGTFPNYYSGSGGFALFSSNFNCEEKSLIFSFKVCFSLLKYANSEFWLGN